MTWAEVALTVLGSAGLSAVVVKLLHRQVDHATAGKISAEARAVAVEAAAHEVRSLLEVIGELRQQARDDRGRIEKLEERERHMLTRAAVHEAWDQLAFQFIAGHDATFPPPPPLRQTHPPAIASAAETDDN